MPLRPNRVHPLWRTDHNNNVGINAPEIEYAFHPDADWIDLTTVHKGGLFGTDYRMLFPGDGIEGIRRFYLDTLIGFGKRGLACQPAIVGVGLGGSKDTSVVLGKQASCLRVVGSRNPDPKIAALEDEFKELGNNIGMGAMGFVGSSMVVDCHIEVGYCHTGGMPMTVHMFCLSSRRSCARIATGRQGQISHRSDVVHGLFAPLSPEEWANGEHPAHVATIPAPDGYRGPYRRGDDGWVQQYAAHIDDAARALGERGFAAIYLDPAFTADGILVAPWPTTASASVGAPKGEIMNSWKSMGLSACAPPLMMFIMGTGRTRAFTPPI